MEAKEQRNQIKVPPILGDIEDELRDLLSNPERLSIHDWENSQNIWSREKNILSLFNYKTTPAQSSIKPIREHSTGQIIGWKEVISNTKIKGDDLSMNRPLLPPQSATQGTANQLPFLPAGYENMPVQPVENIEEITNPADTVSGFGMFMNEELLWIPPTLTNGILFGEDGFTPLNVEGDNKIEDKYNKPSTSQNDSPEENMDLQAIIEKENRLIGFWTDDQNVQTNKEESKPKTEENSLLDECINMPLRTVPDLPVLNISTNERRTLLKSTEWAEMLDISKPVVDFEKKVPQMAHTFPFELDTFQKQAILKLEEQGHVFVAAHTSAGKTVVAEYAIALSKKHCTRTVYTSPIKALSNQKYRDFSLTFGDVGLITGDLQINTTASCLVMTTEILRSMLYRGSDVIRDLEYVIFDEVHYINNVERGYVWEEVLILLPSHVSIVMLSATVPNTLEFADWVGRTKKRKVYVVSTLKRPVPLCHYLYTGSSGSSKDEKFLIIDQNGLFAPKGYEQAVQAKKQRSSNYNRDFGARGPRNHLTPNQEQTMWVAFISHLQDKQLLPVVAFVLSRNRCDITSEALRSVDLTTAREKGRIHTFIQICLKRLKEPDRNLPQVLRMISLLANGIGVHHSGILPILKEIVEMLFQNGLVKILFATETFAMGVNMPARTVIFDSVLKFDGTQMRSLLPAEYIQMAGRAGRRGLDDTGAVIILCKKDVPDNYVLKEMMQGKPMKLSSQFRVTYSTMLSLLRATSVSVESVMQRSFREFDLQCKAETYKQQLEDLEAIMQNQTNDPLPAHLSSLATFYDVATDYIQEMSDLMPAILDRPTRPVTPGRVIILSHGKHFNQLGVFLNLQGPHLYPYKVLVLDLDYEEDESVTIEKTEAWYTVCGVARGVNIIGFNQATLKHKIVCVGAKNISMISTTVIKSDYNLIIQDVEKRQMPRFKNDKPGNTCLEAVKKLSSLSYDVYNGIKKLDVINLMSGLNILNGEILQSFERVKDAREKLAEFSGITSMANFQKTFSVVFERKQKEREHQRLKRLLSYEAMALYPDYVRRLDVLKELRYVDDQNRVAMKGRVACEMKTNELIITELVFRNILTDLESEKIAALLSCLVFQARTNSDTPIESSLHESIKKIKEIDEELSTVEAKYQVGVDDPACLSERLNFGLVQVVYEWAKGKPFAEIVSLTDVQEGIIVRNIQQLHEVLSNVRDAAKIIGDPMLQAKMEEVSSSIKRDIVFFASLYTQEDVLEI